MFESTFKNFNISFHAPNERNVFSSGDPITGQVSFELTKETKISSISMDVTGKASVHWSTGGGGGGRRRRRRQRRHYSAKLDYFCLRSVLTQSGAVGGGFTKLQPGTHVYPFSCQLPHGDFPSTFHGVNGRIVYSMKVGISRPWHLTKDFETELNFMHRIHTNLPELRAPLSGSNLMTLCSLWCASGPITMAASIEKKAFIPGETVKITCKFSNGSSRTATPKVKLQQRQVFYTSNKVHKRMVVKYLASVIGQPISPETSDVHTEMMITIPSSASLTISNCSIITVDYMIEAHISVCASPDLTVLFPIILCDTPVHTQAPPF